MSSGFRHKPSLLWISPAEGEARSTRGWIWTQTPPGCSRCRGTSNPDTSKDKPHCERQLQTKSTAAFHCWSIKEDTFCYPTGLGGWAPPGRVRWGTVGTGQVTAGLGSHTREKGWLHWHCHRLELFQTWPWCSAFQTSQPRVSSVFLLLVC